MSTELKVKVIDKQSQQVLFSCPLAEKEKAYQYAASIAEQVDAEILEPSVTQSLSHALGLDPEDSELLESSANQEIEEHD